MVKMPWEEDEPTTAKPATTAGKPWESGDEYTTPPKGSGAPQGGDYFDLPVLGRQPTLGTFLRQTPTQPGLAGHVARTGLGVLQGFAGPFEWAVQETGLSRYAPKSVRDTAKQVQQTANQSGFEGLGGEMIGGIFNPVSRAIRPVQALNEIGGPTARALTRIGQSALAGAIGGATAQPGNTKEGAEVGGILGTVMGAPGAIASRLGYSNLQQLANRTLDRVPFVRSMFDSLKSAGEAGFNRFWYGHALQPIGGKVPSTAGFRGAEEVADQIGNALDKATAGMWFNAPIGSTAFAALQRTAQVARTNITDTGAWNAYQDTIKRLVTDRLQATGGRIGAADFQAMTSNLAAVIRGIKPTSEGARSLRSELDQFRMRMLDNASGGNPAAYRQARRAWSIYATGRDSVPVGSKDGIFSPDDLAKEIDKREPGRYGTGQATNQGIVNAAQEALFAPTRAARGAAAGRPLTQPEDFAGRAGAAAAPMEQPRQLPETYRGITPGL